MKMYTRKPVIVIPFLVACTLIAILMPLLSTGAALAQDDCGFEPIKYVTRKSRVVAEEGNQLIVEFHEKDQQGVLQYGWRVVTDTLLATNNPYDIYVRPTSDKVVYSSEYRPYMLPAEYVTVTLGTFAADQVVYLQIIDGNKGDFTIGNGHIITHAVHADRVVGLVYTMTAESTLWLRHNDTIAYTICSRAQQKETPPTTGITETTVITLPPIVIDQPVISDTTPITNDAETDENISPITDTVVITSLVPTALDESLEPLYRVFFNLPIAIND